MFHMMWSLYPWISYIKVKEFIILWVPRDYCINACISMQWLSWTTHFSMSQYDPPPPFPLPPSHSCLTGQSERCEVWSRFGELAVRADTNMADFPPQSGSQLRNQKNCFLFPFSLCESLFALMNFDIVLWWGWIGCTPCKLTAQGTPSLPPFGRCFHGCFPSHRLPSGPSFEMLLQVSFAVWWETLASSPDKNLCINPCTLLYIFHCSCMRICIVSKSYHVVWIARVFLPVSIHRCIFIAQL